MDEKMIYKAYDGYKRALIAHHQATEEAATANAELEQAKARALYDGLIDGKNAEQREAAARALLPVFYEQQETFATAQRETRLHLELAKIDVEKVEALLRWMFP